MKRKNIWIYLGLSVAFQRVVTSRQSLYPAHLKCWNALECAVFTASKNHTKTNFAIVHDYLCSFQVSFGLKIPLRWNKIQMTKDAMQQCEEITAVVRKV